MAGVSSEGARGVGCSPEETKSLDCKETSPQGVRRMMGGEKVAGPTDLHTLSFEETISGRKDGKERLWSEMLPSRSWRLIRTRHKEGVSRMRWRQVVGAGEVEKLESRMLSG